MMTEKEMSLFKLSVLDRLHSAQDITNKRLDEGKISLLKHIELTIKTNVLIDEISNVVPYSLLMCCAN